MNAGRVLLLHGPSSSGKTSIARALQAAMPQQAFLHLQLDAFRAMEPPGYWDDGTRPLWDQRVEALCRAMHAAARTYATHGQNVLLDHVMPQRAWPWFAQDLQRIDVLVVGVSCDADELARRERARGDRPEGLAASQLASVHAGRGDDFTLDTTRMSAQDCVARLRAWLETVPPSDPA